MDKDQESSIQQDFEDAFRYIYHEYTKNCDGEYILNEVQSLWQGWKAAHSKYYSGVGTNNMRHIFEYYCLSRNLTFLERSLHDGEYVDPFVRILWDNFKLARESVVVDLPKNVRRYKPQSDWCEGYDDGRESTIYEVQDALNKAGVKYK